MEGFTSECVRDIPLVAAATNCRLTLIVLINSLPIMIISRFILHLRRSEQNAQAISSRPSQVALPDIPISFDTGGFIGDMGQTLDHSFRDHEEPEDDRIHGEVQHSPHPEAGPSRTRSDVEGQPSGSHVERYVRRRGVIRALFRMLKA